jgi:site-specific DNA-cytosine methylase
VITFCDVNGLNGGLAFGMVAAGMELTARVGDLALGRSIINANAHLWGTGWRDDITPDETDWFAWPLHERARVVCAVPPCSGFSIIAASGANKDRAHPRGPENPTNMCMVRTTQYAARHKPDVIIFESVTGAYSLGRELMLKMCANIEAIAGAKYTLTHWLHDSIALGTPTSRKRYFFIAVKGTSPFVVQPVEEYCARSVTPLRDAIGDLEELELTLREQPIKHADRGGDWADARRRFDGMVDGHAPPRSTYTRRIEEICRVAKDHGTQWYAGWSLTNVLQDVYARGGRDAVSQALIRDDDVLDRLIQREFNVGAFGTRREVYESANSLITGSGPASHVHPVEDRSMTYRELARIQGWPDDLRIDYDVDQFGKEHLEAVWGKAVGCTVAEHAGHAVREWLEGDRVGKVPGAEIGPGEWLIDDLAASRHLRREALESRRQARRVAADSNGR